MWSCIASHLINYGESLKLPSQFGGAILASSRKWHSATVFRDTALEAMPNVWAGCSPTRRVIAAGGIVERLSNTLEVCG